MLAGTVTIQGSRLRRFNHAFSTEVSNVVIVAVIEIFMEISFLEPGMSPPYAYDTIAQNKMFCGIVTINNPVFLRRFPLVQASSSYALGEADSLSLHFSYQLNLII